MLFLAFRGRRPKTFNVNVTETVAVGLNRTYTHLGVHVAALDVHKHASFVVVRSQLYD